MIDLENSKRLFERYVKQYDITNFKIKLKHDHTFRVMKFCGEIAQSLGLDMEDCAIAELIGLLHDIGRFEQLKRYDTFHDLASVDHALLGVELLKTVHPIEKYTEDVEIQKIILTAIEQHNKLKIEDGLDQRTLLFCKIIRDADKLDILDLYQLGELKIESDLGTISDACYQQFLSAKSINRSVVKTEMDHVLLIASFLFDVHFQYSIHYIKEHHSIVWILDQLIQYHKEQFLKLQELKKFTLEFLEKRGNEYVRYKIQL